MPKTKLPSAAHVNEIFERACANLAPLGEGARLLLACSAGGDSMTLLDLAARHAEARKWALAVVHVDHGQRPESADEARFVAEQACLLGIPIFIERLGSKGKRKAEKEKGEGKEEKAEKEAGALAEKTLSEDAMRRARHAAFRRFAHVWHAGAVVLAHQADDRAETFLIRLLAGSGPTGLGSIRPVEEVGGLTLVRPLLGARREEMREYLRARGVEWREDPSNASAAQKRGWVRHHLLPVIRERIGYDPTDQIARAAELAQEETVVLNESIRLILDRIALKGAGRVGGEEVRGKELKGEEVKGGGVVAARLDLAHSLWAQAGPLLRRQILRQWLWDLRRGLHPPGYEAVNEALAFAERGKTGAELRTVERMHLVHAKTSLVAFAPEVEQAARKAAVAGYLPEAKEKRKKKRKA